jgi:hypothetical protein
MAKEITLTVQRSVGAAGYDVRVDPDHGHIGSANRNVELAEVVSTARALLTWIFRDGDTIVYCALAFDDVERALRAVEMARRGWT